MSLQMYEDFLELSVTISGLLVCPSTLLCFLHSSECYNASTMFSYLLVSLIMSKRIVRIQSRSISLGQILCGVENQMLMLLSGKVKYFLYLGRVILVHVYPGPCHIFPDPVSFKR